LRCLLRLHPVLQRSELDRGFAAGGVVLYDGLDGDGGGNGFRGFAGLIRDPGGSVGEGHTGIVGQPPSTSKHGSTIHFSTADFDGDFFDDVTGFSLEFDNAVHVLRDRLDSDDLTVTGFLPSMG